MATKEIKVLMVEPGKAPKLTTIKNELESLQDAVSIGADERGLIEIITNFIRADKKPTSEPTKHETVKRKKKR